MKQSDTIQRVRPPGSRLPGILQTALWAKDPWLYAQRARTRYGPIFSANMYPFGEVVYVSDPDAIRRILTIDAPKFATGEANRAIEFVVGPRSLLMLDGEDHKRLRRNLTPIFHGPNVENYLDVIRSIIDAEVSRWRPGSTVTLLPRIQAISMEVMIQAVFGVREPARLNRLRRLVPQLLSMNPLLILFPVLRRSFFGVGPWAGFVRIRNELDEILYAEIRQRRRSLDYQGSDALSLLLQDSADGLALSDAEIRDNAITLLAVGHETTSVATSWFFERVLQHPDVLRRLNSELANDDTTYLDATISETLRIRPPTMDVGRILQEPHLVGGYRFDAGTMFALSLATLHSSEDSYPDPDVFRPERFLENPPDRGRFLPFGGGRHRCIGSSLAIVEMRAIVTNVLSSTELRPVSAGEKMRPRGPMMVPEQAASAEVISNRLYRG